VGQVENIAVSDRGRIKQEIVELPRGGGTLAPNLHDTASEETSVSLTNGVRTMADAHVSLALPRTVIRRAGQPVQDQRQNRMVARPAAWARTR